MKRSIFQLLSFLIFFIILTTGLSLLGYLLWFDAGFSPYRSVGEDFFKIFPVLVLYILPFTILSSIVLSFFSIPVNRMSRYLSVLFVVFVGTGLYYGGYFLLSRFNVSKLVDNGREVILHNNILNPVSDGFIFPLSSDGKRVLNLIVIEENKNPSIDVLKSLNPDILEKKVQLSPGETMLDARLRRNPQFTDFFALPGFVKSLLRDVSLYSGRMRKLYSGPQIYFIFNAASQVIFTASLWSLLRIFRWPLINVFFSLLFIRGILSFYVLWEKFKSVVHVSLNPLIAANLFPALLLFVSLLLFIIEGLYFTSRDTPKGEGVPYG